MLEFGNQQDTPLPYSMAACCRLATSGSGSHASIKEAWTDD